MKIKIVLFFLLSTLWASAQDIVNFPVSGGNGQVRVVNLKENGLMILDKLSDNQLKIQKVNLDLEEEWDTQTSIPSKANFIDEHFDGKYLYLILEPKNGKGFTILKISSSFPGYQKFEFPLSSGFQYGFFAANDKIICLGGAVKNEPFIAIMETSGGTPKFVSGATKGTTELQSLVVDDEKIYASYLNINKKLNQLIIREHDYNGKVIGSKNIAAEANHSFLSGKYFEQGGKRLIVGNYGIGKAPSNGFQSSQGIFLTDIDKAKTTYYNFSNFKNLFSFMSEKQKDKLEKKVSKKEEDGKEYNFDYRLYISGLQYVNDQLLVVGEVFQPEYRSRNFSGMYGLYPYSSMYWGRPTLYNYYWMNSPFYGYNYRNAQIFDGFRYLEGVIFAIDDKGKFKWDQSFAYKNLKYYDLNSHIKISSIHNHTLTMHTYGSKLKTSKIGENGQILEANEYDSESLELKNTKRKAEFSNFEHWYGDIFYNWGIIKGSGNNTLFVQKIIP